MTTETNLIENDSDGDAATENTSTVTATYQDDYEPIPAGALIEDTRLTPTGKALARRAAELMPDDAMPSVLRHYVEMVGAGIHTPESYLTTYASRHDALREALMQAEQIAGLRQVEANLRRLQTTVQEQAVPQPPFKNADDFMAWLSAAVR